jgi:beta-glucosidase
MCALSAVDGSPCCGSSELLVDILRNKWKFDGLVTSDCWGIDDFLPKHHNADPDSASAAIDGVTHGLNLLNQI